MSNFEPNVNNPLNYTLGEVRKAAIGGLLTGLGVLGGVFATSGIPTTGGGLLALAGSVLGVTIGSFITIFRTENETDGNH